jgi:AcrR family transcriptional regulator
MSNAKLEGSARERLLSAANELFYAEGVHTVGIDRVIERAGVAKASLYSAFGSKEELVRAYLEGRAEARRKRIVERLAGIADPRAGVLAVFDVLSDIVASPNYRGCAFVNASAEGPPGETKVTQVCRDSRAWLRGVLVDLVQAAGAEEPEKLGRRLQLLYDGASVAASIDGERGAVAEARATAEALLDAAGCASPAKKVGKVAKSAASVRTASMAKRMR